MSARSISTPVQQNGRQFEVLRQMNNPVIQYQQAPPDHIRNLIHYGLPLGVIGAAAGIGGSYLYNKFRSQTPIQSGLNKSTNLITPTPSPSLSPISTPIPLPNPSPAPLQTQKPRPIRHYVTNTHNRSFVMR
jgi:hypothetical protein